MKNEKKTRAKIGDSKYGAFYIVQCTYFAFV